MRSFFKTVFIVCFIVSAAAQATVYESTHQWEFEFPPRRPDTPGAPVFKNPIFNGDFFGMPTDLVGPISIYSDELIAANGPRNRYGQCTLIVNEPDEVVFKCFANGIWETHYFVHINETELNPYMDLDDYHSCYILYKNCTAITCYGGDGYYSDVTYEDCGPIASRDKWEDPYLHTNSLYSQSSLSDRDHKRDLILRKQFNIPDGEPTYTHDDLLL